MNKYILQHEGTLVELWYLDSFAKFFALEGETRVNAIGTVHKYLRSITLNLFGFESLKASLLPKIDDMLHTNLANWATQGPVDVKQMVFNLTANKIFGYDAENSKEKLSENYTKILNSFIFLPLNIPGTSFNKCMNDREKMLKMLKDTLMERLSDPSKPRGDFLDQAIDDMKTEKFLTEDFIPQLMFGILFASFESIFHFEDTTTLFTPCPALIVLFNRSGYTVPAGWTVILVTPVTRLNPETFKDPVTFNQWRWQDLDKVTISKNFMPFGGGTRQCAGAEYSKLVLSTFLHILVTKYSFTKVRGGDVSRTPIISFGDGIHVKFTARA
ncbi:CYTOCHROME P450 87A3-LIKE [Salix purpurea]|uniref:CYTOCHROME P450 87A3-LIKE n=1 Tax=Salix purpurea TaxID=77065 RepID=A0A9Q1A228_SALPP|nr:CYTOCHROME P450 87A3-LIKE [Salix purpurea]